MVLSKSEEEIYLLINDFLKEHGYSPSIREICKMLGGKSTATVHTHLKSMRDKKFINYVDGMSRTIIIL